ncbi:D-alanine--D-alanine ligase [uncultured Leifsonia sp.]|uniref:D-alanine--D-alanine ligase family protein n=1 Tax=uncultured Leifsonia sp. TaxID=340359 RepID=UPI0028D3DEA1|nr:D-alanine--D-alanine ligase [uncultured Leifsonia sp.]
MSAARTVVVLGGGTSSEHEVSLASARDIAGAVDAERWRVLLFVQERDGSWTAPDGSRAGFGGLASALAAADVVVPAFHGALGEDGAAAGLLELAGVPYVGSGVGAGALGMDKRVTKLVAADAGVAVAPGIVVTSPTDPRLGAVPLPAVVKPNSGGSSHGLAVVTDRDRLRAAVAAALDGDDRVLVEAMVRGREIDVGVLELPDGTLRCSAPLEIVKADDEVFDTDAKYGREPSFALPADLPAALTSALQEHARTMFRALGCSGLARVDFFVTDAGTVLNEVNTFPGFTSRSQFPRMFAAEGMPYPALVQTLLETALA